MTKLIAVILMAIVLGAHCTEYKGYTDEKIYLQPKDIFIQDNQILFNVGENWFSTSALHADAGGVYCAWNLIRWVCRYCHYNNEEKDPNCYRCGRPKQPGQ